MRNPVKAQAKKYANERVKAYLVKRACYVDPAVTTGIYLYEIERFVREQKKVTNA